MSGIPRSKSCLSCQRRKRKCDRKVPICSCCQKNNDVCSYRQRPQVFFVSGTDLPHASRPQCAVVPAQNKPLPAAGLSISQQSALTRTALEVQLHHVFWAHYLPRTICKSPSKQDVAITPKLSHLEYLTSTQPIVRRALDACALTFLGRIHDDAKLNTYAMQVYGRALRSVQQAIINFDRSNLENVVAACRLLSLYEMVRPDEDPLTSHGRDWRRHAQATCELMEMLEKSQSIESPHMQEMRLLAIRLNLLSRRPAYLSGSRWKSSEGHEQIEDLHSTLHELMTNTIPRILQESDSTFSRLDNSPNDATLLEDCRGLVTQYLHLARTLRQWETKMLERLCMDENIPADTSVGLSDFIPGKAGQVPRHLQSYEQALVINQYWASCLLLFSQAMKVTSRIRSAFPLENTLTPLPTWMDPWPYATKIALSASSLLSPEAGLWVSEQSGFPLGSALHFFAAFDALQTPEMQMLKAAIRRPRLSALTNDFLKSVVAEAVPPETRGDMDRDEEHSRMVKQWYGPK